MIRFGAGFAIVLVSLLSSQSWALVCERQLPGKPVLSSSNIARMADHIARHRTYYGEFGLEARSKPTAVRVVQDCRSNESLRDSYFQGLTLRYRVRVASDERAERTYYCVARIKRLRGFDTERHLWGRWMPAGVACSLKASYIEPTEERAAPSAVAYGNDEGSERLRRARDIDDATDPLFSERPGTWGLDDSSYGDPYDGGASGRSSGGFEDWGNGI